MATTTHPISGSRSTRARGLCAPRGGRARSAVGRRSSFSTSPSPDAPANALSRYRRKDSNHPLVTCDDPAGWRRGAQDEPAGPRRRRPGHPDAAAQLRRRPCRHRRSRSGSRTAAPTTAAWKPAATSGCAPSAPPRSTTAAPPNSAKHSPPGPRPATPPASSRSPSRTTWTTRCPSWSTPSGPPGSASRRRRVAAAQAPPRHRRAHHRPGVHLGRPERLAPPLPRPAGPRPGPGRRRDRRAARAHPLAPDRQLP